MALSELDKQIEARAKMDGIHATNDPLKRFYKKSLTSDETPTPVMYGFVPKTDTAVEKLSSPELHNPGEFCYKNMAMAAGSGAKPQTVFAKRVMMNCPFCNKPQFLYNNEREYDGPPDPRTKWQLFLNKLWLKFTKHEKYTWQEQLSGTLTVKGVVTCQFNNLHRFTVIKNKISFYYAMKQKADTK